MDIELDSKLFESNGSKICFVKINNVIEFEKQWPMFMKSVPFGRYLADRTVDVDNAIKYELNDLDKYINNEAIFYGAVSEDNRLRGIIGFHYSSWDSDVLGKRTAIIKYFLVPEGDFVQDRNICARLIDIFHIWAQENKVDVVVARLETQYFTPVLVLQEMGYKFYECNTMKTIDIKGENLIGFPEVKFRYAKKTDLDELKNLALKNTFRKSHFYLDPKLDIQNVDRLYAKWIDSALSSNQKIVLTEYESNIAGVFIYDIEDQTSLLHRKSGVWKFAAVDNRFRNKGLGLNLFRAAVQSCIDHEVDYINTSLVEKNIVSQKLHDKIGFKLVYTLYTFHKWF